MAFAHRTRRITRSSLPGSRGFGRGQHSSQFKFSTSSSSRSWLELLWELAIWGPLKKKRTETFPAMATGHGILKCVIQFALVSVRSQTQNNPNTDAPMLFSSAGASGTAGAASRSEIVDNARRGTSACAPKRAARWADGGLNEIGTAVPCMDSWRIIWPRGLLSQTLRCAPARQLSPAPKGDTGLAWGTRKGTPTAAGVARWLAVGKVFPSFPA